MFLEAPGPSLLAFPHGDGGCPWTVTLLAGKLRLDGVQETSQCNSQPLFKRPPGKRAQSLAQFLIVRVILSMAGDRSLHQKDPSRPAGASRRLAQGHPEAAVLSFPLGAMLLACVVCLGVGGQPCLMGSAGRMGGQSCLIASLGACLWNSRAMKGLVAGWGAGPWRTGPEAVLHHGSGPLSVFVQFSAPWGWGLEG